MTTYNELWPGVEFKLNEAKFFLSKMWKDISPPRSQSVASMASTGALVGNMWQERFYYHLDAFLMAARAIPDVIQMCFGKDPITKKNNSLFHQWFSSLKKCEQERRRKFQQGFQSAYDDFKNLPLSHVRNVTVHRLGTPLAKVCVIGPYDTEYTGGPLLFIPIAASQHIGAEIDSDSRQWADTLSPIPLRPSVDDFTFEIPQPDGSFQSIPLSSECQQYLDKDKQLMTQAKALSQQEHGGNTLTIPPGWQ